MEKRRTNNCWLMTSQGSIPCHIIKRNYKTFVVKMNSGQTATVRHSKVIEYGEGVECCERNHNDRYIR
jgi:hypothetical protein